MGQKDSDSEIAADLIKARLQLKRSEVEDLERSMKNIFQEDSPQILNRDCDMSVPL